ncbi:polysaccharide pyruvyl transferase family protein [Achromobacter sp. LC458]|nr:polysaccharide pyruvyl transferase family protein [Achromobacter sp. LC458]
MKTAMNLIEQVGQTAGTRDLILTTFPEHRSGNVGDHLITHSLVKLLARRIPDFAPKVLFREESLDGFADGTLRSIIAPGFSVLDETYPKLFGLYSDIERLRDFYPIGCSFQHTLPAHSAFHEHRYGEATLAFLKMVVGRSGPLPCRDQLIVDMLMKNGIDALYSGDLAIYDEDRIGTQFSAPRSIKSIVVSVQHHDRYDDQSFELLRQVKARFDSARLFIAMHSKPNKRSLKVVAFAAGLGFETLSLSGDVENLRAYDAIDLHIGYRLHGHIAFLRQRKPSVLLIEDARSFGLANTPGTAVGCFDALSMDTMAGDIEVPGRVLEYVEAQIKNGFSDYNSVFEFVDATYATVIKPYFDKLAKKIAQ